MKSSTIHTIKALGGKIALVVVTLLFPLMVSGSVATGVRPAEKSAELVGRYMMKVGTLSSALPITIESVETRSADISLEKVLLAADAVRASAIPAKLFLDQNYPNPFNPSTMIRYGLPAQSNVRLTIHSLLGSQVKVAFEGLQDPGIYTFDFSAEDLPSGIYFYRLQTDQGTLTRRMTISK